MSLARFSICILLSASAAAQASSLRLSAGQWNYRVTGYDVDHGTYRDFQNDLAVQPASGLRIALEFDWRTSWFPDLAATYGNFGGEGHTVVQTGGGLLGGGTAPIDTMADLNDADITARWPLRLGVLTFSPGLSLKHLSGDITVADSRDAQPTHETIDEFIPQVHGELRLDAGHGLSLSAVAQGISSGDRAAAEWRAVAGWQALGPVLLQVGWQEKRYDLKQSDFAIHARLRGALFMAGLSFGAP